MSNQQIANQAETIPNDNETEKATEEDLSEEVTPTTSLYASFEEEKFQLMSEMQNLREERNKALAMVEDTKKRFLSYDNLKSRSEDKFKYYTGLTSTTSFIQFFTMLIT